VSKGLGFLNPQVPYRNPGQNKNSPWVKSNTNTGKMGKTHDQWGGEKHAYCAALHALWSTQRLNTKCPTNRTSPAGLPQYQFPMLPLKDTSRIEKSRLCWFRNMHEKPTRIFLPMYTIWEGQPRDPTWQFGVNIENHTFAKFVMKTLQWSSRESTCTPPARLSHLIVAPVNKEHSAGLRRSKSLQNS
jgi:hypothetical protein